MGVSGNMMNWNNRMNNSRSSKRRRDLDQVRKDIVNGQKPRDRIFIDHKKQLSAEDYYSLPKQTLWSKINWLVILLISLGVTLSLYVMIVKLING